MAQGGAHLLLGSMGTDEVAALAGEVVGTPPGLTLLQPVEGAAGNPLFVTELVSALSSEGAIEVRDGRAELPAFVLPPPLRPLILRQFGTLPVETIEVLRLASVLGSSFSLTDLSTVLGRPSSALVSCIREAVRAGVLGELGDRRHPRDHPPSKMHSAVNHAGRREDRGKPFHLYGEHFPGVPCPPYTIPYEERIT